MRVAYKTKINVFLTGILVVLMASCNPLGELTRTDDAYCFNAPGSVKGVCSSTDSSTETITVDQTDDDNTASGFGGGSHTGTTYTSGVLTLNTTTNNAELDESWTPQWDNLVAYWKMDESSWTTDAAGTVIDSKGTNDGTPKAGANTTSSAKIGNYAGTFDGSGDYLDIGTAAVTDLVKNFTISAWISPTTVEAMGIVSRLTDVNNKQYSLNLNATNRITFNYERSGNDFAVVGPVVPSSRWSHVLATISNTLDITIYLNGVEVASGTAPSESLSLGEPLIIGQWRGSYNDFEFNGKLDDIAFWKTELTANEVSLIYSRQSAKYAGEMKSRVIDSQNTNSSWTNLDWISTLPFSKELPDGGGAANSESSADYEDLYSDSLMDGLVGLWHLNGSEGTIADDAVISDASGNGNDGAAKDSDGTNTIAYTKGRFSQSVELDGSNDYIDVGTLGTFGSSVGTSTTSLWIKTSDTSGIGALIKTIQTGVSDVFGIETNRSTDGSCNLTNVAGTTLFYLRDTNGVNHLARNMTVDIYDGIWHHIVWRIVDSSTNQMEVYVDGVSVTLSSGCSESPSAFGNWSDYLAIGSQNNRGTAGNFQDTLIDEVAIWSRALDADEILQLYRRGANRIKYQVRTCSSSDCSDQDAETGDGWMGPGGNYLTYFSELYNNSSISSSCAIPQACAASELSLDGDVQTESPSIRFDDFGADGIYMNNNRYFQYRVIMESDDENTACNGGTSTCHPELKSVEIGPAHTYEQ